MNRNRQKLCPGNPGSKQKNKPSHYVKLAILFSMAIALWDHKAVFSGGLKNNQLSASVKGISGNAAPQVIKDTVHLADLIEDVLSEDNNGITVSALVNGAVSGEGENAIGIAVISRDHDNGTWQFLESGQWWNFDRYAVASETQALLFPPTAVIRFNPGSNFTGDATFTYKAWDQSSGTPYMIANTLTNGETTPFSASTGVATVFTSAVNDAPLINSAIGVPVVTFDGANDHVSFADASLSGDFTFEAWVYVNQHQTWSRVIDIGTGQGVNNMILGFEGGSNRLFMSTLNGGSGGNLAAGPAFPTKVWKHVACVNDGAGTGSIYIDGVLAGTGGQTAAPSVVRNNNFIAKSNWGQDSYFNGSMREIRVWDVARSAADIQKNMNTSLQGYEAGLKVYYRTDESTGTLLHDASKTGINGAMNNGAYWTNYGSPLTELIVTENTDKIVPGFQTLDPDAGNGNVTFTLSASNGVLKIKDNITNGLIAANISGNNSKSVTITATVNSIDSTLEHGGLIYSPDLNYYGPDKVNMALDDNGYSGVGGSLSDDYAFNVTVVHVKRPLSANILDVDSVAACDNATLDASAAGPDYSYSWNTGATTSSITVSHNGWYKVTVTDGLTSVQDSTHIGIVKAQLLTSDISICKTTATSSYQLSLDSSAVGTNLTVISQLSANLQNGLIAYYPFNGNGTELVNGGTSNGILNNATSGNNRFAFSGNALSFLKSSNSGVITKKLETGVHDNFTYSVYVNPSVTTPLPPVQTIGFSGFFGTQCVIHPTHGANFGPKDSNAGSGLYVGTNGLYISEHSDGYVASPLVYSGDLSGWHMITIVYDNKVPKLYIDGLYIKSGLQNTRTIWPSLGYDPTNFANYSLSGFGAGFTPGGSPQYFSGGIDDIAFYSRPLSPSDVYELYFGIRSVRWSGSGETGNSITVTPVKDTTYTVTVSNGLTSCEDNVSVTFKDPEEIIKGDTTVLKAKGNNIPNPIGNAINVNYSASITDASITIIANQQPEDLLNVTGTLPDGVTQSYNSASGMLTIKGTFTAGDLENLFKNVTFATSSKSKSVRKISFSLGSALPSENGHFYNYISNSTFWTDAKADAASKTLFGMQGYLATITSAEENAYIRAKLSGNGWVGLSDDYEQINTAIGTNLYANQQASDGNFYWVTGPETGQLVTVGNVNPVTQAGMYGNWNPGEPNGANGAENFGQLYTNGQWNDLSNSNEIGYVIEYGGLPGEPCQKLVFTKQVITNSEVPIIAGGQKFNIDENSRVGTAAGTVAASDADGTTAFSWAIVGGNTGNAFRIDPSTGVISVNDSTALDYEKISSFNLSVTASDGANVSAPQTIRIILNDLNDSSPVITSNQSFAIDENSAKGTIAGTVVASDADSATTYSNWTIVSGNTGNAFEIDPVTGIISVNDSTALDYEIKTGYNLFVTVSDGASTSAPITVKINLNNLNDTPPVILSNQQFSIDENSANGTVVDTIRASDADGLTGYSNWTIVSGNTGNAFVIDPVTGIISVNNNSALDYEQNPIFTLSLTVGDGSSTSLEKTIKIKLNNLNDTPPVVVSQDLSLDENSASGTVVGTIAIDDPDGNAANNTFSITSGNTNGAFAIDPATGIITVADSLAIDYETNPVFSLVISAFDGANTSAPQTIMIRLNNLNDSAPEIDPNQSFSVDENSKKGKAVGTVLASDADGITTYGQWTIVSGNTGNAFAIDPATGVISVNDSAVIDYEENSRFNLSVTVSDGINASSAQIVKINLNDLNDNAPIVAANQSFVVNENSAHGTLIGTVHASDADGGTVFGVWTITGGNTDNAFSIDPVSGAITINDSAAVDFEKNSAFTLSVAVSDGANSSAVQTVKIRLNDLNDTAPVISANQSFYVDENTAKGQVVATLVANDADGNTLLGMWAITGGNTGNAFSIDPNTGVITVNDSTAVDFEKNASFQLTVTVGDGTNTSPAQAVVIHVNNTNDNAPVIAAGQSFAVSEDSPKGTSLGALSISDPDGLSFFGNWTIVSGNTNNVFSIDPSSGIISVNAGLDYDVASSYVLMITAGDGINTSIPQAVTVNITNVNNIPPVITPSQSFTVSENSQNGTVIGTPSITDGDGATVYSQWTIVGGNDDNAFSIDPATGVISVSNKAALNYEKRSSYALRITARDGVHTSNPVTVIINIGDTQDGLVIYTAFSPNDDGVDDTWAIDGLESYPSSDVKIFNGDGHELYSNQGYTRQWDGRHSGTVMPVGSYYYVIELNDASDKVYKGTFMIIK